MRMKFHLSLPCLALAASCLLARAALGQTPQSSAEGDSVRRARDEFTLATELAQRSQWLDALSAYERSYALRPHPVTQYNIGFCERALGRFTRARQAFRRALADHEAHRGGTMRAAMVEDAQTYLREADQRVARVIVSLDQRDVGIAVNGRPLEVEDAGESGRPVLVAGTRPPGRPERPPARTFELLVDPGSQVFVLSHDSLQATVVEREFSAGSATSLRLHVETPKASVSVEQLREKPRPNYTAAYLVWGVAAAGAVTGSTFGIAALRKRSDLESHCVDVCPPSSQGDIDAMKRYALISDIGFGVAIVGGGVGTYLFLRERGDAEGRSEQTARTPRIVPWVGPGSAGATWHF
jgi:hypothetical protein